MTTSPISCKALLFAAVALLTGLFTGKSHAQWVEATGTAQIRNGNKTEAKHNAVQNAIKDALLFAGASVSSVQQVTDGLLTQDHFKVTSHGNIEQMELVDEVHRGQFISVTIRADIIAEFEDNQCEASPFKKSLAITQMSLVNREQAKIGGLYNIGEALLQTFVQTDARTTRYRSPSPLVRAEAQQPHFVRPVLQRRLASNRYHCQFSPKPICVARPDK